MKPTRIGRKQNAHLYLNEWFAVRGLTHQMVADRIGVARNTVSRYANEQWRLRPDKIANLAHILGLESTDLYRPPAEEVRESVDKVLADQPEDIHSAVLDLAKRLSRRAG